MLLRMGVLALAVLAGGVGRAAPDMAALAEARRREPDAARPRIAMEQAWTERPLPAALNADDIPYFPVAAQTLTLPAADGLPASTIATLLPGAFLAVPPAREPRSGVAYPCALGVYAGGGVRLELRFRVHFMSDDMAGRARRVGRWLGALSVLGGRLLGPAAQARYPMSVWLSPDGAPGAETWNGSIVLHGVRGERSGLEWVRQLTHEWGHAAIPGGGGFARPEAWAAGDLGERLFLPAMRRAGWLLAWDEPLDIDAYARRYVDPPRAAFARTGPVPDLVAGTGAAAYDHSLGAELYIAAAYGMPLLAESLNDLDGPRTADLLAAFTRALAARREWTVHRVPGLDGPAAVCIPARGRYILETHGPDGKPVPLGAPKTYAPGWTRLDWRGDLTVRRLFGTGKG